MSRILVVEDEPLVAMQLQESLEVLGHEVPAIVDSADGVLSAVLAQRPDLVIMDIRLKSFSDGIDAAARLRLMTEVPLIYLTACPGAGSEDRARRTRPAAYLVKPVTDAVLAAAVASALSSAAEAPA